MNIITNLWGGRIGLAKAYWGFGILAGLIWLIVLSLVKPGSVSAVVTVLLFCSYYLVVNTGIWRAASSYAGPALWANLAKVAAALGVVMSSAMTVLVLVELGTGSTSTQQASLSSNLNPFHGKLGTEMPGPSQASAPKTDSFGGVLTDPTNAPSFAEAEGWTQERTGNTEKGPWLSYLPPGSRFCRMSDRTIIAVFPPGMKPQAEKANPFCATASVASLDQL